MLTMLHKRLPADWGGRVAPVDNHVLDVGGLHFDLGNVGLLGQLDDDFLRQQASAHPKCLLIAIQDCGGREALVRGCAADDLHAKHKGGSGLLRAGSQQTEATKRAWQKGLFSNLEGECNEVDETRGHTFDAGFSNEIL